MYSESKHFDSWMETVNTSHTLQKISFHQKIFRLCSSRALNDTILDTQKYTETSKLKKVRVGLCSSGTLNDTNLDTQKYTETSKLEKVRVGLCSSGTLNDAILNTQKHSCSSRSP
jgi:hypothetical protein